MLNCRDAAGGCHAEIVVAVAQPADRSRAGAPHRPRQDRAARTDRRLRLDRRGGAGARHVLQARLGPGR
ncbi:MAG: hypothetical protein MZV49_13895 [Rhodopseudomonas palustris]|nr:hypothetical protein [Rhodopseudomonas palustris]